MTSADALAQTIPAPPAPRPAHVVQGERFVTDDPSLVLTTILGSCVAACLRDPLASVGGMNHFLLPGDSGQRSDGESVRYGVHAMELLVNDLLARGARRDRLEGKLFGGARLIEGLTDVGALNAEFAEHFLRREGIAHVGGSLRGEHGRRIQFWPVTGRARQVLLGQETQAVLARELSVAAPAAPAGALELF
jgi:chemotaxis protein CheD